MGSVIANIKRDKCTRGAKVKSFVTVVVSAVARSQRR
jgi:hypothetical protein